METHFYWEDQLIPLALEAISEQKLDSLNPAFNQTLLQWAYRHCEQIIKTASKTFYLASALLPMDKRSSIRALYAFCRVSDDLVDQNSSSMEAQLDYWRKRAVSSVPETREHINDKDLLVALAWEDTRSRHCIPALFVKQLIHGVSNDLVKKRYESFSELASYCYGVACTVGLMSMHIIGYVGLEAVPYAIRLGVALQLTNILRDVGEDWQMGRVYLPREEMQAYGISGEDIAAGVVTDKWRTFMRFQIDRVRLLYASALPGIRLLHPDGRFAIGAAAELYREILNGIENNDYDVFSRRAASSAVGKLRRLPGIWRRSRSGNYPQFHIPENWQIHKLRDQFTI